jgi:hypothetical protein
MSPYSAMRLRVATTALFVLSVSDVLGFQMMNTIRSTSRHRNICSSSFLAANVKEMSPKLRAKRINRDDPDKTLSFQRSDNGTRDSEFLVDSGSGNPFYQVISTLTPGELVGQFISSASPRVQAKMMFFDFSTMQFTHFCFTFFSLLSRIQFWAFSAVFGQPQRLIRVLLHHSGRLPT